MFKALIKKQTLEILSFLFKSSKGGGRRSKISIFFFSLLMLYVVGTFGTLFYLMSNTLCKPLTDAGLDWLFFALMAGFATVFGVIGSVFATQSQLYEAKDNELLLSMPIPPSKILFSRMISLYIQTLFFEALVLVPATVVYFQIAGFNIGAVILLFLLPLLALALSCVLGWLVALITSKITNKSLFSLLLSIGFLAVYFYLYSRMNSIIQGVLLNSAVLGGKIKSSAYILYQLGKAFCGDITAFLLIAALCILLFSIVYIVLSVSFIKIVTTKRSGAKRKYVKGEMKVGTVQSALLKKELMRFYSSPAYMLNCGLGSIFMVAGAVYLFIKGGWLLSIVEAALPGMSGIIPLLGCAMVCLTLSTNDITAPSVSLEGKSLWLTKSLPVDTREIFKSKLNLHLVMTSPVAFICAIAVVVMTKPDMLSACLIPLVVLLLSVFCALFGLAINLKLPNFTWVNETAAVKQSASVGIALFGGWGVVILLGLGYLPLKDYVTNSVYLLICAVVLLAACAMLYKWIMTRGVKIFNNL